MQRLVSVLLFEVLSACAPHPPAIQELQGRCDRDALAWFQVQHPGGVTQETVDHAIHTEQYTFSDHYNSRLQRCFAIASEEMSTVYPDKPSAGTRHKTLMDLSAHMQLGQIVDPWPAASGALRDCSVESKHCSSMRDWEELVAPYLDR